MHNQPLVTIAITAYNRPELLKKAIESCINQTYKNLDILISDNCSTDPEVEIICREYASKDIRIRYIRQKENIGMFNNWKFVETNGLGEYYLGVSDDDWLDENFVEECMKVIINDPECSLVCGYVKLYDENYNLMRDCLVNNIDQDDYTERLYSFFNKVASCFLCYGIKRTSDIKKIDAIQDRSGEDWIYNSKIIFLGKCYILENCSYNKVLDGATATLEDLKKTFNFSKKMTFNDIIEEHAKICYNAILNDDFFIERLPEEDRIKLAQIISEAICENLNTPSSILKEIIKYMWQHPLFLFRAKFYSTFFPRIYTIVRYMWQYPLFLFRAEFYSTFFPRLYKIVRYTWRHPLFLFREDFYNLLSNKPDLITQKQPLVSIQINTYNRYDLLKKALDSAINQTYKNIEVIISDNHSNDGTEELCKEYMAKDSRIKYFRQSENIGMTANANFSSKQINGEYWLGLCDDDWVDLDYVEKLMDFALKNPDYSIVFPLTKLYDKNYNLIGTGKNYKLNYKSANERVKKFININFSNFCLGLYKTSILKKMQELDGGMFKNRLAEDWMFIVKYLAAGKGKILSNVYYHKLRGGITKDLEATKALWGPADLNANNFWDKVGESLSNAILEDKFFEYYLNEKQRKKLAKTAYKEALYYKRKEVKKYIWRHPLFLFRKDFWKLMKNIYCT